VKTLHFLNVVNILWLRQMKRYVRSAPRMFGTLGQPLLFFAALGFGLGPVFQRAGEGKYLQFLAPGVVGMTILFAAVFTGSELIWDRQFGFLKETLVAPVPRVTIMIGRTLGGTILATIQGMIVMFVCFLAGFRPVQLGHITYALVFMVFIALMFTALGTVVASFVNDFQGFQLVVNVLVMPMFLLSGALYPLTNIPRVLQLIARANPLAYGVDGMRGALVTMTHFGQLADLTVMSVITTMLLLLGTYRFGKIQI
jgi:ABC-2 type transport system permease protein